ncbi:MAG TPA: carboxypeptidase-like regulatory domain-containing protein, partial [Novosphingobium sp.]|nr:carboxypeptidase-like regulatory domain-containing protein [Novosphingobium sp.]
MPCSRFLLSAAALAACFHAAPAHAQQAGLQIALVDAASGEPAAGVEVRIDNADIGFSRTLHSDAQGFVRLEGVTTAGTWRITALAGERFESGQQTGIALRANFT